MCKRFVFSFSFFFFPKMNKPFTLSHSQTAPLERQACSVQVKQTKSSDVTSHMWVELAVVRAIDAIEAFLTADRLCQNSFRMATRLHCIVPLRTQRHILNILSLNANCNMLGFSGERGRALLVTFIY